MSEDKPKRRRLGMSTDEFLGGTGAVPEVPVDAPSSAPQPERLALSDDLDASGRPYRPATDKRPADPQLTGGWGRIVRTVFKIDEEDAFRKVSAVTFAKKPSRMEHGELIDALDDCSGMAVLAGQLYENAKVVFRMYELDVEALRAPMRKDAKAKLAEEKAAGGGKMITNDDVTAKIAEMWPDEWRRQEENLAKAKGMQAQVSNIHDRWVQRARELDGLVRSSRKV